VIINESTAVGTRTTLTNGIAWVGRQVQKAISLTSNQSWLEDRLRTARREALAASAEALCDYMRTARIDSAGLMAHHNGSAHLILHKPGSAFRKAADAVGLIQSQANDDARLTREYPLIEIQVPWGHPAHCDADAQRVFCVTAGTVMQKYFPSERWTIVLRASVARDKRSSAQQGVCANCG
jgi:beta-xylosidase